VGFVLLIFNFLCNVLQIVVCPLLDHCIVC
jgi:hypothetical protein